MVMHETSGKNYNIFMSWS